MAKYTGTDVIISSKPSGTVPSAQGNLILQNVIENSVIMNLGKYEEMKDAGGNPVMKKTFSFLTEGPGAYWVGEGEKIKTSKATWLTGTLEAQKIAVIIPCSKEFLKYSVPNFFEEIKDKIAEAFYKKFDEAGILGVASPFAQSIDGCTTTTTVAEAISYDSILEAQDFVYDADTEPNAFISKSQNHSLLRNAVSEKGEVIFDKTNKTIDGLPVVNLKSANMEKGTLYTGNFDYMYYGIPWEIEYEISEQAQLSTIVNADDSPINLFEQDMIALKATMHLAFMVVKENAFAKIAPPATEPPATEPPVTDPPEGA